ncbi:hypothetical protein [Adoxophyes orana nucleopolyhedrovirus]|uniref:hypothetical protein n=1 Tax=Adoxophyes orana nucleopolyhedrovirus TaxID=542343 RepID=UPI0001829C2F|nr:hypothetical protein [Adoxophyes orana nucleopolyhedrovirus]ACF05388.1 hypothetical protein [Adoxophyes orana nucleopolyhedrovirus]
MNYNRDLNRRRHETVYNTILQQHENLKMEIQHLKQNMYDLCRNSVHADKSLCDKIISRHYHYNDANVDKTDQREKYITINDKSVELGALAYNGNKPLVSVEPFY